MNGLTLAYLGDAYYELYIRKYLISLGFTDVDILHKKAVMFTSGKAQAEIFTYFQEQNILTEKELDAFKRGRNASPAKRHNISAKAYQTATGFEALIGNLSIYDETRCHQLIELAIRYMVEKVGEGA